MEKIIFYGYGFLDRSSNYDIELSDPRAFQTSEYVFVIKEEKEQEFEEIWSKDAFFGKKR